MPLQYFLGRYQPDPGEPDEYDGNIWCVDPEPPPLTDGEGNPIPVDPEPTILASVPVEDEAKVLLEVLQQRDQLLAACREALECRHYAGVELECFVHNSGLLKQLRSAAELVEAGPV